VPAPATRTGANDIVVLELEQVIEATAAFVASPDLGHREE
jgi:beta-galactosidase